MPLDPTDPYYIAEVTPASIGELGRGLCAAYNRPSSAFGSKGNTVHYSGYHRSRRWILRSTDSAYGSADYSVRQTLDKSGDENWISAFDFTPGSWGTPGNRALMRELTGRVYNAAKARDPRLSSLREFAGTINGTSVITFNCSDGSLKGAFDSSHLDHVHGSLWRSRAANDHSGILAVMLGDDMAQLDDIQAAVNRIEQGSVVPSNALIYWIRSIAEGRQSAATGGPGQGPDRDGIPEVLTAINELPTDLAAQIAIALAANPAFINGIADQVAAAVGAKIGGVLTDIINGSTITGTIQAPTA